jgi:1,4-alpha-glucan branching enzyme
MGMRHADEMSWHNRPYSIEITIPPLAAVFFTPE